MLPEMPAEINDPLFWINTPDTVRKILDIRIRPKTRLP
jgi:hypothetical protein